MLWQLFDATRLTPLVRSGSNPSITDTELQLAKFVVPEHDAVKAQPNATETIPLTRRKASLEVDLTKAARIEEKYVEGEHRFDPMFYGSKYAD